MVTTAALEGADTGGYQVETLDDMPPETYDEVVAERNALRSEAELLRAELASIYTVASRHMERAS